MTTTCIINLDQNALINQKINESLQAFELLCQKQRANPPQKSWFRRLHDPDSYARYRRKMVIQQGLRQFIFRLDAKCGFPVHRTLKRRLITTGAINQGKFPYRNVRIWRLILAEHIQESGVSVRTRNYQNPGHWESGPNVIRILPYQTEKQLFTSLLPAFSHQLLHFRTGRAKSRPFVRAAVHRYEATVFSYIVARSIGLESLFRVQVINDNPFCGGGMSSQSKQQIREAAFELLTNLWSRYDHLSGIG